MLLLRQTLTRSLSAGLVGVAAATSRRAGCDDAARRDERVKRRVTPLSNLEGDVVFRVVILLVRRASRRAACARADVDASAAREARNVVAGRRGYSVETPPKAGRGDAYRRRSGRDLDVDVRVAATQRE